MSGDKAPLDHVDADIMRHLATLHTVIDPPPADLDERVLFAIDLENLDIEVARQSSELRAGSGTRAYEQTRTITFEAGTRTILITISERPDGLVRIDGWLAPGAALRVELRSAQPATSRSVTADETGRFVLDGIPHGLAQLVVHPADSDRPGVATSSIVV